MPAQIDSTPDKMSQYLLSMTQTASQLMKDTSGEIYKFGDYSSQFIDQWYRNIQTVYSAGAGRNNSISDAFMRNIREAKVAYREDFGFRKDMPRVDLCQLGIDLSPNNDLKGTILDAKKDIYAQNAVLNYAVKRLEEMGVEEAKESVSKINGCLIITLPKTEQNKEALKQLQSEIDMQAFQYTESSLSSYSKRDTISEPDLRERNNFTIEEAMEIVTLARRNSIPMIAKNNGGTSSVIYAQKDKELVSALILQYKAMKKSIQDIDGANKIEKSSKKIASQTNSLMRSFVDNSKSTTEKINGLYYVSSNGDYVRTYINERGTQSLESNIKGVSHTDVMVKVSDNEDRANALSGRVKGKKYADIKKALFSEFEGCAVALMTKTQYENAKKRAYDRYTQNEERIALEKEKIAKYTTLNEEEKKEKIKSIDNKHVDESKYFSDEIIKISRAAAKKLKGEESIKSVINRFNNLTVKDIENTDKIDVEAYRQIIEETNRIGIATRNGKINDIELVERANVLLNPLTTDEMDELKEKIINRPTLSMENEKDINEKALNRANEIADEFTEYNFEMYYEPNEIKTEKTTADNILDKDMGITEDTTNMYLDKNDDLTM